MDHPASTTPDLAPAAGPQELFDIRLFTSLPEAETMWRELEATGTLTPYQRFDWLSQWQAAGIENKARLAIAVMLDGGTPLALLPLTITSKRGHVTAYVMGTNQSNVDWMILAPGFHPTGQTILAILARIADLAGGIDLVSIQNQPQTWSGQPNPLLALPHVPAASHFYGTSIAGVAKPFIETRLAPKRRGDLKRGRRRMEEALGPVRLVRVDDAELLDKTHAIFLDQRRQRFDEMGIDNVFETPSFVAFFRDAARASFGAARPVLVAHALMAGNDIVATTWGTTSDNHYSLYINSTTSGPASRFSLMTILIADLMDELLDWGIESFDIGLGDFSYKERWTEPQVVYNSLVPLTAKGRLAAALLTRATQLKRTIKQNPKLWSLATRVRLALFRLSGRKHT